MTFDPKTLSDGQLYACIQELRNRGTAVATYSVDTIMELTEGWDGAPERNDVEAWFDDAMVEELMCDGVRHAVEAQLVNCDG